MDVSVYEHNDYPTKARPQHIVYRDQLLCELATCLAYFQRKSRKHKITMDNLEVSLYACDIAVPVLVCDFRYALHVLAHDIASDRDHDWSLADIVQMRVV